MTAPPAEQRSAVLAMAGLFLLMTIAVGAHFSFGVFFTPLLEDLGWSHARLSSVFSVYMAVYTVAQVASGAVCDRFGAARVVAVTGVVFGLGFVLMGSTQLVWHAYLAYGVLVAVGFSGSYIPAIAATSQILTDRRPMALGVATAGSGMGLLVVGPVGHQLYEVVGVRSAYRIMGLFVMLGTAAVAVSLRMRERTIIRAHANQSFGRGSREGDAAASSGGPAGMSLPEALREPACWRLVVMHIALNLAVAVYAVHAVSLGRYAGLSAAAASAGLTWAGLGRVSGSLLAGRFSTGRDAKRLYQGLALAITVALLSLPFVAGSVPGFAVASVLFGLGFAGTTVVFPILVSSLFGSRAIGGIFGFVNIGYGIGGAIGPLMVGWLYDVRQDYTLGFVIAAAWALAAGVIVHRLRPGALA